MKGHSLLYCGNAMLRIMLNLTGTFCSSLQNPVGLYCHPSIHDRNTVHQGSIKKYCLQGLRTMLLGSYIQSSNSAYKSYNFSVRLTQLHAKIAIVMSLIHNEDICGTLTAWQTDFTGRLRKEEGIKRCCKRT